MISTKIDYNTSSDKRIKSINISKKQKTFFQQDDIIEWIIKRRYGRKLVNSN